MTLDHAYEVLGLPPTANWREVKHAYRRLALLHHPDRVAPRGTDAEAAFDRYADAYRLLRTQEVWQRASGEGASPPVAGMEDAGAPPLTCLSCGQPYRGDPGASFDPRFDRDDCCPECGAPVQAGEGTDLERVVRDQEPSAQRPPPRRAWSRPTAALLAVGVAAAVIIGSAVVIVGEQREREESNRARLRALAEEAEHLLAAERDTEAVDRYAEICRVLVDADDEAMRRLSAEAHVVVAHRAALSGLVERGRVADALRDEARYQEAVIKYGTVLSSIRAEPPNVVTRILTARFEGRLADATNRQHEGEVADKRVLEQRRLSAEAANRRAADARALLERATRLAAAGGTDEELSEITRGLLEAAGRGDSSAMHMIGKLYRDGVHPAGAAVRWYPPASGSTPRRDTEAAALIADSQEWTHTEAARWFRKAAELGHVEAMTDLGVLYTKGFGVRQNGRLAVQWLRRGLENGNHRAALILGTIYESGRLIPADVVRAARLYEQAAQGGNAEATRRLKRLSSAKERVEQP